MASWRGLWRSWCRGASKPPGALPVLWLAALVRSIHLCCPHFLPVGLASFTAATEVDRLCFSRHIPGPTH